MHAMTNEMQSVRAQPPQRAERNEPTFLPLVDIHETETEFVLLADMPGAREVDVELRDGVLHVNGRVAGRHVDARRPLRQEYGVGDYHRTFRVGEVADPDAVRAEYRDGVLEVHLPKRKALQPRKIRVRGS